MDVPYKVKYSNSVRRQVDLVTWSQELKQYLIKWGYPEQLFDTEIHRVINKQRTTHSTGGDISSEHELSGLHHQTPPNYSAKLGTSERDF